MGTQIGVTILEFSREGNLHLGQRWRFGSFPQTRGIECLEAGWSPRG